MISPTVTEVARRLQPCSRDTFADETQPAGLASLLDAARHGDASAWTAIVRRYEPVIRSATRAYGLGQADADDVAQTTWLRLLEQRLSLREPEALPGWLATTARRESMRLKSRALRSTPVDPAELPEPTTGDEAVETVIAADRGATLRGALASLTPRQRTLLEVLARESQPSYRSVADELGIAIGSIGPTRARALDQLRKHGALAACVESDLVA